MMALDETSSFIIDAQLLGSRCEHTIVLLCSSDRFSRRLEQYLDLFLVSYRMKEEIIQYQKIKIHISFHLLMATGEVLLIKGDHLLKECLAMMVACLEASAGSSYEQSIRKACLSQYV